MLLTFIDFILQGYLKKKKWPSKLYFPFYWVFSILTLSFLYRPLVYNFLDNKLGKRISLILIPIYFTLSILGTMQYKRSNYLDTSNQESSKHFTNNLNYEDLLIEEDQFVNNASIPSKIIETPYLNLFLGYDETIENTIFYLNEDLKPDNDVRGYISSVTVGYNSSKKERSNNIEENNNLLDKYFKSLKSIHTIKIDSTIYKDLELLYTLNKQKQLGLETVLDINKLNNGKHILTINRQEKVKDSIINKNVATIPFWYFKN